MIERQTELRVHRVPCESYALTVNRVCLKSSVSICIQVGMVAGSTRYESHVGSAAQCSRPAPIKWRLRGQGQNMAKMEGLGGLMLGSLVFSPRMSWLFV